MRGSKKGKEKERGREGNIEWTNKNRTKNESKLLFKLTAIAIATAAADCKWLPYAQAHYKHTKYNI